MVPKINNCCYFSTTVMMVDDNARFLNHLSACLDPDFHFKLFSDPINAIEFLEKQPLLSTVVSDCFSCCDDIEHDAYSPLQHNHFSSLHHLVFNHRRFEDVSVIIVDYAMPSMNGLELCRRLKNHPAKKIMLTGEAGHRLAVEAFNEGIIDRFILKQTEEKSLHQQLNAAIADMMSAYFVSSCDRLLLGMNFSKIWDLPPFKALFGELLSDYKIQEFYLLNPKGSMLLLDQNGKCYWLLIEDQSSLDIYARMAEENDAPIDVTTALKKRMKLPFFFDSSDEQTPFESWSKLLYPAKRLGQSTFYFSFQTNNILSSFKDKEVKSLSEFLKVNVLHSAS